MVNVKQLNSLALAYIGDAVYEVHVRNHLIMSGQIRPNELQQRAVSLVSATAKASGIHHWMKEQVLTEEEAPVVRRRRKAKADSTTKNMPIHAYRHATVFEALIGYHYLEKNETRLDELLHLSVQFIEDYTINEEGTKR